MDDVKKKEIENVTVKIVRLLISYTMKLINENCNDANIKMAILENVLINFVGNVTIEFADEEIISNFKKVADAAMRNLQNYFDYAVPQAIERELKKQKEKENVN